MNDQNLTHTQGVLRVCCADPRNLRPVAVYSPAPGGMTVPGLTAKECVKCERRHYEIDADAGYYDLRNA